MYVCLSTYIVHSWTTWVLTVWIHLAHRSESGQFKPTLTKVRLCFLSMVCGNLYEWVEGWLQLYGFSTAQGIVQGSVVYPSINIHPTGCMFTRQIDRHVFASTCNVIYGCFCMCVCVCVHISPMVSWFLWKRGQKRPGTPHYLGIGSSVKHPVNTQTRDLRWVVFFSRGQSCVLPATPQREAGLGLGGAQSGARQAWLPGHRGSW